MTKVKPKTYKKAFLFVVVMVCSFILGGCGIGEQNEKKLFDAMKDNGLLDLVCEYEDYDNIRQVDQSPVPAVTTYYEYNQNGVLYTIDYRSVKLKEDDFVYQVRVEIEAEEESDTSVYYFEKDTFAFREKKY